MNKDEMEESESCKGLNVQVKDFNFIGFSFRPNRPWKKLRHRAVNDLLKVRVGTVEPSDLWPHSYGKLLPEKLISPTVEMDPRGPQRDRDIFEANFGPTGVFSVPNTLLSTQ